MSAAADTIEIRVPDIGDFEDVEVIEVLVTPGDRVEAEDSLVTIESDKASMEVPSPRAGVVEAVLVAVGDKVSEGSPLVRLRPAAAAPAPAPEPAESPDAPAPRESPEAPAAAPVAAERSAERAANARPDASRPAGAPAPHPPPVAGPVTPPAAPPHASPKVRRFARELGVDLGRAAGSGPHGRILEQDVKATVRAAFAEPAPDPGSLPALAPPGVPGTHHDEADVRELEAFRAAHAARARESGVELGLLPVVVKAVAGALRAEPALRRAGPGRTHVALCIGTAAGPAFPVVRDVEAKGLLELAADCARLEAEAREGRLEPGELVDAVFAVARHPGRVTTPILPRGLVGSLAVGRVEVRAVWDGSAFAPHPVLPLSLAFDPRSADATAAWRFLATLRDTLADPARLLL